MLAYGAWASTISADILSVTMNNKWSSLVIKESYIFYEHPSKPVSLQVGKTAGPFQLLTP